jgi:hypothetical protein
MALDTDPTSDTFDALVSVDDANLWHNSRGHNDEWRTPTDIDKETAIRWATNLILLDIVELTEAVVPTSVANACAEQAFLLMQEDRTGSGDFDSVKLGSVSISTSGSSSGYTLYSDTVNKLLRPYMMSRKGFAGFKRY